MLNELDLNVIPDEMRLMLCLPDRTEISELYTAYGIILNYNYGGIHQLSFKLPYRVKDKNMRYVRSLDVDLANGDYLIKYVCGDIVDYYIITKYTNSYDNGKETMSVECNFLPYELSYKVLLQYKQIKQLYTLVGTDSIIHDTLLSLSDWTVAYCDSVASAKFRSFDVSQTDLLSFLNQVANSYNLVLEFDTVNKTVSFYDQEDYGVDEGLEISEQYLKSLSEVENHAEIVTRLYPIGKDNLSIIGVSPTGTNYITNLDFYMFPYEEDINGNVIQSSHYMSDELCHAIKQYDALVTTNTGTFNSLLSQRETLVNSEAPYLTLDAQYKADLDAINASIDIAVKNGQSIASLNTQKSAKQAQINNNQATINGIESQISTIDSQIAIIRNTLAIENNFTLSQIAERNKFIREKVWVDTKYIDSADLLADAIVRLNQLSEPNLAYEIDSIDILRQLNNPKLWYKLKIGSIVTVKFDDFGINYEIDNPKKLNSYGRKLLKAKVINLTHSIDDNSLKLTIANYKDIRSGLWKLSDLLNKTISTGSSFDFSKGNWDLGKNANDTVTDYINNALDAAKQAVIGGVNNSTQIDNRGITTTDTSDANKILRINAGGIFISADGQQSFRTAITSSGVVADVLAGNIVLSNNLLVSNTAGTVSINGSGMTVSDMIFSVTKSDKKSRILIDPTNGLKIQSGDGTGNVWTDKFYADANGNIIANNITANSANIQSSNFTNGAIVGSSINIGNGEFTVSSSGVVNAKNGTFRGDIQAEGGYFSGNINAYGTISGGTISGATIVGGSITSNTQITVGTNLYVGDRIYLNQSAGSTQSIISNGNGDITFGSNGMTIAAFQRINLSSSSVTYNGDEIATKDWVRSQGYTTA